FQDVGHYAVGVVPGDGIFTTWSYRAGAGRAEAFLLNPQPLSARMAHEWGVVAEVVPNGKALSRGRELAELYLNRPRDPESTTENVPDSLARSSSFSDFSEDRAVPKWPKKALIIPENRTGSGRLKVHQRFGYRSLPKGRPLIAHPLYLKIAQK
ncbi:MAG: enoyl-CoA hydratase-related protein, partial [Candidatus Binataceae bacterium]